MCKKMEKMLKNKVKLNKKALVIFKNLIAPKREIGVCKVIIIV